MYAIYLKCPNGRFHPLDLTTGETVNNRMFASLFKTRVAAEDALAIIKSYAENAELEVRKIGK